MTTNHTPQYKPGDIANGHRLNINGTWEPIPVPETPASQQPEPKKSHTTRNVLVTLGVIIFILFAGCTALVAVVGSNVDENTGTTEPGSVSQGLGANDATADVVLGTAVAPDAIGITYLPITVTNHSAKRSDYLITVAADAPNGNRIETGYATPTAIEPGQATVDQVMFTKALPADVVFTVIGVQRTASL